MPTETFPLHSFASTEWSWRKNLTDFSLTSRRVKEIVWLLFLCAVLLTPTVKHHTHGRYFQLIFFLKFGITCWVCWVHLIPAQTNITQCFIVNFGCIHLIQPGNCMHMEDHVIYNEKSLRKATKLALCWDHFELLFSRSISVTEFVFDWQLQRPITLNHNEYSLLGPLQFHHSAENSLKVTLNFFNPMS